MTRFKLVLLFISLCYSSFAQFDITSSYKIGELCDTKYQEFGLGIWHEGEKGAYYLSYKDTYQDHKLLGFTSKRDCNSVDCKYKIALFMIQNNRMEHRYETELRCKEKPYFEIILDQFILVSDKGTKWEDIKSKISEANIAENNVDARVFVVAHEKLNTLKDLNLSQLKIFRNTIFAKHGYTFQSHALDFHFREQDWYKPLPENQKDTIFTAKEVFLVHKIQKMEKLH